MFTLTLLSDVHGSLSAPEAVPDEIAGRKDGRPLDHPGDLVGDGPWPDGVVRRIRREGIPGIAGAVRSSALLEELATVLGRGDRTSGPVKR